MSNEHAGVVEKSATRHAFVETGNFTIAGVAASEELKLWSVVVSPRETNSGLTCPRTRWEKPATSPGNKIDYTSGEGEDCG
ncbi:hypothetical protein ACLKA7_000128 [Drosophila subpalustris]